MLRVGFGSGLGFVLYFVFYLYFYSYSFIFIIYCDFNYFVIKFCYNNYLNLNISSFLSGSFVLYFIVGLE